MKRAGRPKKLSSGQERDIRKQLQRGSSTRDITKKLRDRDGVSVSCNTVRAAASRGRHPLTYKSVIKKPFLTEKQRQDRLTFALANQGRNWRAVMFTDSKIFTCKAFGGPTKSKVWAKRSE